MSLSIFVKDAIIGLILKVFSSDRLIFYQKMVKVDKFEKCDSYAFSLKKAKIDKFEKGTLFKLVNFGCFLIKNHRGTLVKFVNLKKNILDEN